MNKKKIIIAEIKEEGSTNGVSRYIEMLREGLYSENFEIVCLVFIFSTMIRLHKHIKHQNYTEIIIPLPINPHTINKSYWNDEYNHIVSYILRNELMGKFIFHIQTMNLIQLAIYLRANYDCKIVSHIHCIPWKYLYEDNKRHFNHIFKRIYIEEDTDDNYFKTFTIEEEYLICSKSDAIICVTKSSKNYYETYLHTCPEKVHFIPNGLKDRCENQVLFEDITKKNPICILYVGTVSKAKGVHLLLEALNIIESKGYNFELIIAGKITEEMKKEIKRKPKLKIKLLGQVSFDTLCSLYKKAHIGVITSLFEQCSYVAIEMSMFALPTVYSGIEELHEIFDKNAGMFIPALYNTNTGLTLDKKVLASKIELLINSPFLRRKIGQIERTKYLQEFTLEKMINRTIKVYNSL
ncbi:MAG: glycosyltransferase family 4 protein [Bacteroidaceae bacterium]|nr:glycosyltransferase family 4 protein [Prevotellaceae bacterium]MDY5632707.1 glycosyltransferase family 4 protein [Bacteroidaceae bacterium]